jgi:hypothetical protein
VAAEESAAAAALVAPPREELEALLQLARVGNMRNIRAHAERLAALDVRYRPLATRLARMAENFETVAIVELLRGLQEGSPSPRA